MTSSIDAARQTLSKTDRFVTFHRCSACDRVLSIPEFIERHCEACKGYTKPVAVKERVS
ncbi:hypothetical protein [Rhizobium sp. TAL182]|uniref:hypothetical protein n=1 Tax=Rhizobium sp. TAL182 TaxID=2020313 RepID=UPI0013DDC0DB|nr:hypothetical protein [Rhizobium sp. TAL182]